MDYPFREHDLKRESSTTFGHLSSTLLFLNNVTNRPFINKIKIHHSFQLFNNQIPLMLSFSYTKLLEWSFDIIWAINISSIFGFLYIMMNKDFLPIILKPYSLTKLQNIYDSLFSLLAEYQSFEKWLKTQVLISLGS